MFSQSDPFPEKNITMTTIDGEFVTWTFTHYEVYKNIAGGVQGEIQMNQGDMDCQIWLKGNSLQMQLLLVVGCMLSIFLL